MEENSRNSLYEWTRKETVKTWLLIGKVMQNLDNYVVFFPFMKFLATHLYFNKATHDILLNPFNVWVMTFFCMNAMDRLQMSYWKRPIRKTEEMVFFHKSHVGFGPNRNGYDSWIFILRCVLSSVCTAVAITFYRLNAFSGEDLFLLFLYFAIHLTVRGVIFYSMAKFYDALEAVIKEPQEQRKWCAKLDKMIANENKKLKGEMDSPQVLQKAETKYHKDIMASFVEKITDLERRKTYEEKVETLLKTLEKSKELPSKDDTPVMKPNGLIWYRCGSVLFYITMAIPYMIFFYAFVMAITINFPKYTYSFYIWIMCSYILAITSGSNAFTIESTTVFNRLYDSMLYYRCMVGRGPNSTKLSRRYFTLNFYTPFFFVCSGIFFYFCSMMSLEDAAAFMMVNAVYFFLFLSCTFCCVTFVDLALDDGKKDRLMKDTETEDE